jgi:prevent-host-death family protein
MGIPKIKSATHFRDSLYETLKEVSEGESHIVTNKNGRNVVLISQENYNRLLDECQVLRSIATGVADLDAGRTLTHKQATTELRKLKSSWK